MVLPTPLPVITPGEATATEVFHARTDRAFRRALAVQEMTEGEYPASLREDSVQEVN